MANVVYPSISKYCSSIRHPQIAFNKLDRILAAGKPVEIKNSQGFQNVWSAAGGFACVFKYETFNPKKLWAVRCFQQSTSSVASHYSKVSRLSKSSSCSSYFVECSFLDQGIRVEGKIYPIVKMEWAEGKDLKSFIRDNINNKNQLDLLAQAWVKLSKDLFDAGIAHGDLQHGNITVDDSSGSVNLKLIDYDSLYFASVDANSIDDEIKGLPGYQHPLRDQLKKQCLQIDFFPQLVIYISIIAIAEKPQLWNSYNIENTDRLLFSLPDIQDPDQSQVFTDISQLSPDVSQLAEELKKICKLTDFSKIPSLDTVLTPPTQSWNPGIASQTTSAPSNQTSATPQSWKPRNSRPATSAPSNQTSATPQSPQSWNPGIASQTTSAPSNQTPPTPQSWNPGNSRSRTSAPSNQTPPTPQSWNPGNSRSRTNGPSNRTSQSPQTGNQINTPPTKTPPSNHVGPTSVSTIQPNAPQRAKITPWKVGATSVNSITARTNLLAKSNQTILQPPNTKSRATLLVRAVGAVAIISTIATMAIGGFSYYQYQRINQLEEKIEQLKRSKNDEIQQLKQKSNELEIKKNDEIQQLKKRSDELEIKVDRLTTERDNLQSRVNQLTKYTYLNVCNKTSSKTIDVAVAYWNGDGLLSKGWWKVKPRKCTEISIDENYRGNVYVYGMSNQSKIYVSGSYSSYSFCVDKKNVFEINKSDKVSCGGQNKKRVRMSEFYVSPGTNTWDFN